MIPGPNNLIIIASSPMPRWGRATPPGETGQASSFCDNVKKDCEWLQYMYYMWGAKLLILIREFLDIDDDHSRWLTWQSRCFSLQFYVWTFVFAQIPGACKTVVDHFTLTAASPWESTFIFHREGKWVCSIFHWGGGWVCPTIILSCFNHCWYKSFTCTFSSVTLGFPFPK